MNYEGNFHWQLRVVQQGPWKVEKIETSFLLDKQWQSTTYHSWHDIQLSNKEGFGHAMRHTWSLQVLMFLNKHWTVYVSFCKSVFSVVSLLEASPVHETLWDQREVVQKFERVTFLVYGYPTNDKRTFHFQCLENDSCPWVVSLQELFLDWKYDILKEAQKSSKKCYFTT